MVAAVVVASHSNNVCSDFCTVHLAASYILAIGHSYC